MLIWAQMGQQLHFNRANLTCAENINGQGLPKKSVTVSRFNRLLPHTKSGITVTRNVEFEGQI